MYVYLLIIFQFVFTDIRHNLMYVTTNYGINFSVLELNFTPSEVSFHEQQSSTFVVLDKNNTNQEVRFLVVLSYFYK